MPVTTPKLSKVEQELKTAEEFLKRAAERAKAAQEAVRRDRARRVAAIGSALDRGLEAWEALSDEQRADLSARWLSDLLSTVPQS